MQFFDDIYIGRDNYLLRRIETIENVPIDITNLTRTTLETILPDGTSYIIDSDSPGYSDVFDWSMYGTQGLLGMRLGIVTDIPVGHHTFKLVIYSDDYPSGLDDMKPVYLRVWDLSNG